jgi:LacI family transcriptional regulator
MSSRQRVTIKDVAEAAGVSVQTVSRVINDRPDVAAQTRQRILKVIDQLGYQPSNIARSLIQGRSCTLGVVGYGLEYYGPSRVLAGIEHQASELGYTLLFSLVRHPEDEGLHVLRDMLAYYVDGIIFAVTEVGSNRDWAQEEIAKLSIPVVFLHTNPRQNLSVVDVDNRAGGRMATEHLLQQGCHNIGLITGPIDWWAARERVLGWRDALEAADLPGAETLVFEGDWSALSGECGLHQLLMAHPTIDSVFASNDQMALGVFKAARKIGLRVPEDLAVVGFDDIPEAAFFCPALTTISQDLDEVGRRAVRELIQRIEADQHDAIPSRPCTILLQPELVVRESTMRH